MRRRDNFRRAYDAQCVEPADAAGQDVVDINACGLELRRRYGFPDPDCPIDSPMAELDGAILAIPEIAGEEPAPLADPVAPPAGEGGDSAAP